MSTSVDDVRAPAPSTGSSPAVASSALSPVEEAGPGGSSRAVPGWAWAPVAVLVLAILALKVVPDPAFPDAPGLRAVLAFVFGTLVSLVVVALVGRSFLIRGQPGMLLLGCGILFLGGSGVVAALVGGREVNLNVTIFNLCAGLGALCHLAGAFLLLRPRRALPAPGLWLGLAALVVVSALGLVALAACEGWVPVFFIQGEGGTPTRQLILGLTITFFVLAGLLPGAAGRRARSPFFQWYGLALSLLAAAFFGVMLQPSFGSLLSWTAWAAMCLSGVYMLVAALASVRESRAWGTSLEAALHESEERFQALTRASFEGIAMGEGDRLIDGNDQFFQMLGYRREELLGRQMSALHTPEDRARVSAIIRSGHDACIESTMLRKDGSRILVEAHGKPLVYRDRAIRVVAFRDITAHKQAEQALQQAQAQLQAHAVELEQTIAQRTAKLREALAELEHFSYAITHDMRAPLRAMQGYAELLSHSCGQCLQTRNQEFFRRIQVATGRMDQLITDSLNYSRAVRQDLPLQPVPLQALLQGMVETYPHLLPDQADIELAADLPTVLGSEAALTQIFGNLLGNAVKFAKPGTRPHIRVRAEPVPSPSSSTPLPKVRLWVEDDGIGISPEMQERIFGLFERATNELEGTGLGLAIVRKLVRRLGGEAGVNSQPGQGSRFWVELALAPAASRQGVPSSSPAI